MLIAGDIDPLLKISGEMPKATGELPTFVADFEALDNLTAAEPMMICIRTADTAL